MKTMRLVPGIGALVLVTAAGLVFDAGAKDGGKGLNARTAAAGPHVNLYDPKAEIDFAKIDPSIDPGVDPDFLTDPVLNKSEDYTYVFTKPGDHKLPADVCAFQYDVNGPDSLLKVLTGMKARLAPARVWPSTCSTAPRSTRQM